MPADEGQPRPRQLPFESESSDQEVVAPARSSAARVPPARAAALLAVAAAALVLLAVAGRSAWAATGARREAIVSMSSYEDECHVYGYHHVSEFGKSQPVQYSAEPGWIWLVNSSTVQVQGLNEETITGGDQTCVAEVTIGGPILQGGVLHIGKHNTTWYPAGGSEEVVLVAGEIGNWSLPGIIDATVDTPAGAGDPMHKVTAMGGDFKLVVDQWDPVECNVSTEGTSHSLSDRCRSATASAQCMNKIITKPLESGETGLCVNAEATLVSDADNLAMAAATGSVGSSDNAPSSKSSDASSASTTDAGSAGSDAGDKSGTADTLLYFALSLGCANSIVPFVL